MKNRKRKCGTKGVYLFNTSTVLEWQAHYVSGAQIKTLMKYEKTKVENTDRNKQKKDALQYNEQD